MRRSQADRTGDDARRARRTTMSVTLTATFAPCGRPQYVVHSRAARLSAATAAGAG
ncbi:hypothetical protein Mkiyose1088_51330 [Mycobacterium kiyosense]|nr:hypothetical protein SRL2020130_59930 [Mycobacterium kiyosense]GLC05316.1 hypothetical protein SRL2020400_59070 [Mycobacterium kiyosense]GLC23468.1 hypothetical protein SRL2020472_60390 [Mycobacterium kiyosense]GLD03267.1 hypothetical protein Mkiyose1088_51330 [Mycobacterium kiyosense]GLD21948.1 hypothetical protein Mkiyose1385_60470 [Mycobacterium kiyosense]